MLITPEKKYDVQVFGVVTIAADSDKYQYSFSGKDDKQSYLDWIMANSEINTGVTAFSEEKIVMLSTCTYEFDDARLVVYGKLCRNGGGQVMETGVIVIVDLGHENCQMIKEDVESFWRAGSHLQS